MAAVGLPGPTPDRSWHNLANFVSSPWLSLSVKRLGFTEVEPRSGGQRLDPMYQRESRHEKASRCFVRLPRSLSPRSIQELHVELVAASRLWQHYGANFSDHSRVFVYRRLPVARWSRSWRSLSDISTSHPQERSRSRIGSRLSSLSFCSCWCASRVQIVD